MFCRLQGRAPGCGGERVRASFRGGVGHHVAEVSLESSFQERLNCVGQSVDQFCCFGAEGASRRHHEGDSIEGPLPRTVEPRSRALSRAPSISATASSWRNERDVNREAAGFRVEQCVRAVAVSVVVNEACGLFRRGDAVLAGGADDGVTDEVVAVGVTEWSGLVAGEHVVDGLLVVDPEVVTAVALGVQQHQVARDDVAADGQGIAELGGRQSRCSFVEHPL